MNCLTYNKDTFLLDGKPFRILSGAIHYFRVPQEYWEDRLKKLKACGLNTVETYCCWNLHEKQEGSFDFESMLNLRLFLQTAQKLGLYAIVRPGPYICAEFDYGGLPYWLNRYPLRLRCNDPIYMQKVAAYFERLFEQVRPMLASWGGNVIAMQIENEYGSYGNDKEYLRALERLYKQAGMDCLLFTSDGPEDFMLTSGTLPDVLATCNFGSRGAEAFASFRRFRPEEPFMCMEFWNGWFDHWGTPHHTRSAEDTAQAMEEILDQNNGNGSLNFYMFHGGTNFGFTAGANHDMQYTPTITSYDYDCLLTEWGDLTEKYHQVRSVLRSRYGIQNDLPVENLKKQTYGRVKLTERGGLFENLLNLSRPVFSPYTQSMEELKLPFGFVLYSTELAGEFGQESEITLDGMRDRALIYINNKLVGIKEAYRQRDDKVVVSFRQGDRVKLDILVENMGRTNFGHRIGEKKGIAEGVRIGNVHHSGWTMYPLELADLSRLSFAGAAGEGPVFYRGSLEVEEPRDTFVQLDGFTKGVVFVNGFNLGRYWNEQGPQKALYLPGPMLRHGENEILVFELEHTDVDFVDLTDRPRLDG